MTASRSSYPYSPYLPPRPAESSLSRALSFTKTTSTSSATPIGTAHSPPRKVVTDFAAFGAPATASVFGTAVASTPFSLAGGKAAFGGMRSGRGLFDDEEEEEEDDGRQKIELREDSITFEQVRGSFLFRLPAE